MTGSESFVQAKSPEIMQEGIPDIFITHHANDRNDIPLSRLEEIFRDLSDSGVTQHRFDIRWGKTAPEDNGSFDAPYLTRSADVAETGKKSGLDAIVNLSAPPKWAMKLLKHDSGEFLRRYEEYAVTVRDTLAGRGVVPKTIQVFNELNNPVYTPKPLMEILPDVIRTVRKVYGDKTDISGTVIIGNIASPGVKAGLAMHYRRFMEKFRDTLGMLDRVGIDYYPGLYHISGDGRHPVREGADAFIAQTDELENSLAFAQKIFSGSPVKLEIDEFGFPTGAEALVAGYKGKFHPVRKYIPARDSYGMRYAYDKFMRALKPVITKYPVHRLGLYQLFDEPGELAGLGFGLYSRTGEEKIPSLGSSGQTDWLGKLVSRVKNAPSTG